MVTLLLTVKVDVPSMRVEVNDEVSEEREVAIKIFTTIADKLKIKSLSLG